MASDFVFNFTGMGFVEMGFVAGLRWYLHQYLRWSSPVWGSTSIWARVTTSTSRSPSSWSASHSWRTGGKEKTSGSPPKAAERPRESSSGSCTPFIFFCSFFLCYCLFLRPYRSNPKSCRKVIYCYLDSWVRSIEAQGIKLKRENLFRLDGRFGGVFIE